MGVEIPMDSDEAAEEKRVGGKTLLYVMDRGYPSLSQDLELVVANRNLQFWGSTQTKKHAV